jgi:hypothetical protein
MEYNSFNDDIAEFARRQHDWMERVLKGSLSSKVVAHVVQLIIDRDHYPNLTMDYGVPLEEMIARGHYSSKNVDVNATRFRILGSGVEELEHKLFHFNDHYIPSEEAVRRIIAAGWQPARIEHLLEFCALYREEGRYFTVVALGSVNSSGRFPLCCGNHGMRHLGLDNLSAVENRWEGDDQFLAVRKPAVITEE